MAEWELVGREGFQALKVRLSRGETVTVESGSFLLSRGNIEVRTTTGGLLSGVLRALAGGESVFLNEIRATGDVAEVWIAPPTPGDIAAVELTGQPLIIQDSSYLAHIGDVRVSVAWRGLKGLLAEGELVWLKAEGSGTVFINSFGSIERIELAPGERVTVDNWHFVAMDSTVRYDVRKFGGWKTFILGGEGLVVEVEGPGRIWVQTRNVEGFAGILRRFIPVRG